MLNKIFNVNLKTIMCDNNAWCDFFKVFDQLLLWKSWPQNSSLFIGSTLQEFDFLEEKKKKFEAHLWSV